jgi:CheY-like chemotaxis protein
VLTGILGFTELALAQQLPTNTPLASYLNEVFRAAQNGAQYTQQLRLFARRQSNSSRSSHLAPVLAEEETRLFSARDSGVTFRLHVPADLPPVALDAEHLQKVLGALLDNAREALVGPGSISVSTRLVEITQSETSDLFGNVRPGPHVEITVADTGIGLSSEAQEKLFSEAFFTTKPRRRGFGLATAYGILHAHRGGLRLHSGGEGGVVARIVLPVAPVSPASVVCESAVRPSEKVGNERILVVDDEPEVLQFMRTTLEYAGYRVESYSGAPAALDCYFAPGNDPFQLVVTDIVMPSLNGLELVRRLLKRDPAARVLFVSGHVPADFTQQDLAGHGFELLSKPFRPDQLLRAARAALDRPRAKVRSNKE